MKLITLLLFVALMQASASGYSQITLNEKEVPLETVLQAIKNQTGYHFFYDTKQVSTTTVSINIKNATIEEALEQCFKDIPFTYKIIENNVLLKEKEKTFFDKITKFIAVPITVTGIVKDENGSPLPDAIIKLKGTPLAWTSNIDGRFYFRLPSDKDNPVLIFTYLGFKSQEIKITSNINLSVKMVQDVGKLDEVAVVGYGTTTKRLNTGATAGVTAADLEKRPLADPILMLEGMIPGLQVTSNSGLPGSAATVLIRGVNSLNRSPATQVPIDKSNSPFYIVDGVPFISNPLNASGASTNMGVYNSSAQSLIYSSPFKSINPEDIESIEVLKDADATAIYGARGANGVIIITTKRAKAGKTSIEADVYSGIGKVPYFINTLNTQEYLSVRKEAYKNAGITPTSNPNDPLGYAPDLTVYDPNAYTNWQKKYAGGNAVTTNAQATISGGTEQTRFLFNTGYRNQGTVTPGDFGLTQGSFRINLDHNSLDKRFTMNVSAFYSTDINKLFPNDPYGLYTLPPNQPLYKPDGSLFFTGNANPEAGLLRNYQDQAKNLNGNLVLGYQILKTLNFKVSIGYNKIQQDQVNTYPKASFDPTSTNLSASRVQATNSSGTYLIEPQLNYNKIIGNGTLGVLLGGTYQQSQTSSLLLSGSKYTNDDVLGDISAAPTLTATTSFSQYRYISGFARINYNWGGKYIINATGRRDGSNKFGPGKRFGDFGAVGAAWIFTEEPMLKNNGVLSFGKLRGSYGVTGNDKISDYQYFNTYTVNSNAPYQGVPGFISNNLGNTALQWETNTKLEAAIELGFFKNHILLTADYYRNRTGNSLISYPLATQTGFSSVTANLDAQIQNSGFEFSLVTTNIKNKTFTWTTNFNLSLQRNKLLSFPNLATSPYNNLYTVGQSISNVHGFVFDGADPKTGAATFKDLNGNGVQNEFPSGSNAGDQTIIANSLPDFYGGINNTFIYKNFQLDIFFNYRKLDQEVYNASPNPGSAANIDHTTGNRWQNIGDVTNTPAYAASFFTGAFGLNPVYLNQIYLQTSNYYLRNGSYLKLSNASLAYTLPKLWAQRVNLSNARIYISAQNLFTISNYPGPDPDSGISMPSLRTIVLGIRAKF